MQDLGDNRHFQMLQIVIVSEYSCKSHDKPYTHFNQANKSLFCLDCVNEMQNVPNLFYFKSKQEILSKFLNVFNIKFCRKHNLEITDYCLGHIKYYCNCCLAVSGCSDTFKLVKSIINEVVKNTSQTLLKNLQNQSSSDKYYEDIKDFDDPNMFISLWSKNNNIQNKIVNEEIIKSKTDLNVNISSSNQNNLPNTQNAVNKNNNNNVTVLRINLKTNIKPVSIENFNFCYPFLNNGKLVLYDSEKKQYKKLTFTDKIFDKKDCEIIKYMSPNSHREFIYIKHERVISRYDKNNQVFSEVVKFDRDLQFTFFIILGINDNLSLVGLDMDHRLNFMNLDSKTVNYKETQLDELIDNNNIEYYMTTQKRSIYELKNTKGDGSLLIYFWGLEENSITIFILNKNYEELGRKYNDLFAYHAFKDQSQPMVINSNFRKKFKSLCKNSFFYELDSKLYLCFIFSLESYQFLIDLQRQTFKLHKHTRFEYKSIGFSLEKKDEAMINIQSGENIYYLNRENVLIQFDVRNAVFSQKFEFI